MKKIIVASMLLILTGCGAGIGASAHHVPGFLYSETKTPAWDLTVATNTDSSTRSGTAMCKSVLGLIATGDCSVEAAKRNGGLTRVNNVEFNVTNILSVYAEYTTKVYGQ